MSIVIAAAEQEDLDDLVALNHVAQSLHIVAEPEHFRADVNKDEVRTFFAEILTRNNTFIRLAKTNDHPIGYIWYELQDRPATPFTKARRRIYVHHVVVSDAARWSGVGSALIQAAETQAQDDGCDHIALDTWAFNKGAQMFFGTLGFAPLNVIFEKRVA